MVGLIDLVEDPKTTPTLVEMTTRKRSLWWEVLELKVEEELHPEPLLHHMAAITDSNTAPTPAAMALMPPVFPVVTMATTEASVAEACSPTTAKTSLKTRDRESHSLEAEE